jgi:hypothetical protein
MADAAPQRRREELVHSLLCALCELCARLGRATSAQKTKLPNSAGPSYLITVIRCQRPMLNGPTEPIDVRSTAEWRLLCALLCAPSGRETALDLCAVNVIAYDKRICDNSVRLEFVMRIGMLCALCARITNWAASLPGPRAGGETERLRAARCDQSGCVRVGAQCNAFPLKPIHIPSARQRTEANMVNRLAMLGGSMHA